MLVPYEDKKEGFSLSRPEGWEIVEKAGATLLIEDPKNRKNSIGVVVNPVRIDSLTEFGDPESVGEKLLAAERKKVRACSELFCAKTRMLFCGDLGCSRCDKMRMFLQKARSLTVTSISELSPFGRSVTCPSFRRALDFEREKSPFKEGCISFVSYEFWTSDRKECS